VEATPLQGRIGALEERVDRILAATEPDPVGEGGHLAGVEVALLEALQHCPDTGRGHPVLADAAAWRERTAELGEAPAAERADAFLARLIESYTNDWKDSLPDTADDPDAWFRALAQARAIDLEALSRRAGPPPLREELPALRARFVKAVEDTPPDRERRRQWVTELIDRADVVLIEAEDVDALRARRRIDRVLADLRWHRREVENRAGTRRARLDRKIWRLRAEGQELDLKERLEARYTKRRVVLLEKLVLWLIVVVLVIFGVELFADLPEETLLGLRIIDLTACIVFLTEFFLKLSLVRRKRLWFSRHFLVDFVPSIPFAFMVRWLRAIRVVRFLRVVRFVRAFGFATRGIDRVVRRYGRVLNRNIILYPTRGERAEVEKLSDDTASRLHRLQGRVNERWQTLLANAPQETRSTITDLRVEGLQRALQRGLLAARAPTAVVETTHRDLLAEDALGHLASFTPQLIVAEMGQDFVARLARAVRMMAAFRWLPVLRRYIPRVARGMDDPEVVAAAAHKSAAELTRHYDRYFWFADLYGTVTPAQFVDRVGTAMVKGAKRPVVRLIMFGLLYLIVQWLLGRGPDGSLAQKIHDGLRNIVGTTLLLLGGVGMAFLAAGWWLRAVAGQATDFFTQSARAAYIGLTESIKGRQVERDADIFERRVFFPERLVHDDTDEDRARFVEKIGRWLVKTPATHTPETGFDHVERAVWIYRDNLDGALFGDNDVHTTAQMLGNPALRNLRLLAERFSRRDTKELLALDLERQKSMVRGPYLWFSLVCKAIEHGVARLVVDYNRHAVPLVQLPHASDEERAAHDAWLDAGHVIQLPSEQVLYVTNEFTAMHFLDADESRDRHVEVRFGAGVLARMQRDRRFLIRRVFGTFPLHKRPRDERMLNLYRVYQSWFAGGRTLLVPLRVFWNWLSFLGRMARWLVRCVGEIRRPRITFDSEAAEGADFRTAMRMIRRMRGPIAEMALRMRTRFDPEYLGVRLPGTGTSGLEGFDVDHDLAFLQATTQLVQEVDAERRRVERDMVRRARRSSAGNTCAPPRRRTYPTCAWRAASCRRRRFCATAATAPGAAS